MAVCPHKQIGTAWRFRSATALVFCQVRLWSDVLSTRSVDPCSELRAPSAAHGPPVAGSRVGQLLAGTPALSAVRWSQVIAAFRSVQGGVPLEELQTLSLERHSSALSESGTAEQVGRALMNVQRTAGGC